MNTESFDLDSVISEIGEFGKFQIINSLLISVALAFAGIYTLSYIFTAGDLSYRCKIPECDEHELEFDWINNAIPFNDDSEFENCERYSVNMMRNDSTKTCDRDYFDEKRIEKCNEFVFENDEKTILNEWNLTCKQNVWKLTLVGTLSTLGQFLNQPISGIISDRYGRRFIFVLGFTCCGVLGIARSFAWNYASFLTLEFIDPFLGAGVLAAGFILGAELVGPKYRVIVGSIISIFYALGEALLGLLAMVLQDWRWLLRSIYAPAFICLLYPFLIPESVRWLLAKGRVSDAANVLLKAAAINKQTLSKETIECLNTMKIKTSNKNNDDMMLNVSLWSAFKQRVLLLRVINCSLSWAISTFVFYGLNIASVSIGNNKYESFIYVALIEIPALYICWLMAEKLGRVDTLSITLIASGLACLATIFIDSNSTSNLIVFLLGKFTITIAISILYIFTAELFPTPLRHSLFGVCAMFGRFGMILAPQTPLLATYMKDLPMIIFCVTAILAGVLATQLPETLGTELPHTIDDAAKMQRGRCRFINC